MAIQIGYCGGPEMIEKVKGWGYDYIEMNLSKIAGFSDEEFEKVLADLKKADLPCLAMNVFLPGGMHITGRETNHDEILAYAKKALARAHKIGAKRVVLGSGGARNFPADFDEAEANRQFVDFVKKVAPIAQENEITIVLEPLNSMESNILNTVARGMEIVKEVNHPNLKVLADYYHMLVEKESVEDVVAAGADLHHTHTANLLGRKIPLKANRSQQKAFADALKKIDYCGGWSVEASPVGDVEVEAVEALGMMRELVK